MRKTLKGFFVVLDGIDGCGKTLHSKALRDELKAQGFDAVYTAEPSDGSVGKFIQGMLLKEKILPEVEALLFAADRYDHLKTEILPSFENAKVVVCDRYLHSSLAYQGAQGVDVEWIRKINSFAIKPDIAFYLDVPPDVGLSRIKRKRSVLESFELERKVRDMYLQLVDERELVLVDSNRPIEEVKVDLLRLTLEAFKNPCSRTMS